jgi:hypothetical protein
VNIFDLCDKTGIDLLVRYIPVGEFRYLTEFEDGYIVSDNGYARESFCGKNYSSSVNGLTEKIRGKKICYFDVDSKKYFDIPINLEFIK